MAWERSHAIERNPRERWETLSSTAWERSHDTPTDCNRLLIAWPARTLASVALVGSRKNFQNGAARTRERGADAGIRAPLR